MKKALAFILALVFVIGCIQMTVSAVDSNPNLISNGDFEVAGNESRYAKNWESMNDYRRVNNDHGNVMQIGGNSGDRSCFHDSITLKKNTYYCYSAKILRNSNTGDIYIDLYTEDKQTLIEGSRVGVNIDVIGQWVTVSCIFNSGEHTVVKPHLATSKTGQNYYKNYFDDVTLTELTFPAATTIGTPKATFTAATESTSATFAATDNGLYITELSPYITQPQEVSLVNRISNKEITWVFNKYEAISILNGIEHTVTFLSSDEKYQLQAVITQRTGDGPLEFNQYITGLTEGISIAYSDAISANIAVQTDGEATLYRFSRSRVNGGADPYFSQGVLTDTLTAGASVFSSVENHYDTKIDGKYSTGGILPYQVLDIGGNHGVYFGYYWSFGKMLVRMNDGNEVAFTAYLAENSEKGIIVRDAKEELSIPGFFICTYEGSVDDGSNQMKDWFWDHKMTRSLNENENEPYIEIGVINDQVAGIHTLFDIWPDLADYANILKLDWGWTVPNDTASYKDLPDVQKKWVPDTKYGPSMGIYDAIQEETAEDGIDKEVLLALYMAYTFEGVNLDTEEGREKQLAALKERMNPEDNEYGIGYEYWRSDFDVERSYNYDDHEGLLYILDKMIAYSDDFRYEHCMGGGSLKDFTTLERMTFMTTEDTALPLNHRMSLYANTYMINPLQLKADISMGLDEIAPDHFILESGLPGYTDETYVKYALRTGMLGAMNITFNEAGYNYGNNLDIIKEHYDLYNNTHREILRNANVYHILSSPTGWDYTDWDGIEYYNPELNKGVVQLFKENKTAPNAKQIVLEGLNEDTMYALTFIDRTEQNTIMSGAELMSTGLTVTGMDTQHASEIIYIEPYQADDTSPTIVRAVAISDTEFSITTSKPIQITTQTAFALFLVKDGVVDNLDERSNVKFKETGTRYGGTISPTNKETTTFTWTINSGVNATDVITKAVDAGYEVYFGLNGSSGAKGVGTDRAADSRGNGFAFTFHVTNSSHKVYAVPVAAYQPLTVNFMRVINASQLEIGFSRPLVSFNGAVLLGVLDASGNSMYSDNDSYLDDTVPFSFYINKEGNLICTINGENKGMPAEDRKNIYKIIEALEAAYPDYSVGVQLLERNDGTTGLSQNGTGYLEEVKDQDRIPLKGTGKNAQGRDYVIVTFTQGAAQVGGMIYDSIENALQNAVAGDTIVLIDDAVVSEPVFVLNAGVTLDLKGHQLTVNHYLLAIGEIIDSDNGAGKLVIAKENILNPLSSPTYLPLYDEDGYRFFAYEFRHVQKPVDNPDQVQYSIGLGFTNKNAYQLLASEDNADMDFGVKMTITKPDGSNQYIKWVFSDALMEEFAQKNATTRTAITLTISGMTRLSNSTYTTHAILTSQNHFVNLTKDMVVTP